LDGGSAVAIVLVFWNRVARHRALWCQAVFCRERLRQWHFQLFLDGELVRRLMSERDQAKGELDKRWGELQQNLRDGYGMMTAFIHHGSHESDIVHKVTPYDDPKVGNLVLDAMWTLRVEHQLRLSQRRIEPVGEQAGLTLDERARFSEAVAVTSFAGAVLVGASGLLLSLYHNLPVLGQLSWDFVAVNRIVGGSALILAVMSAASRAYRAGYTLPGELDSYKEYADRTREVEAAFRSAESLLERFRQMEKLETEAAAELRRFLRMKMQATFVF
jgi:hypothetical protein